MRAYNLCMVVMNLYIATQLLRNSVGFVDNWQCDPLVFGEDERSMAVAAAIWWFYVSKSLEMLVRPATLKYITKQTVFN